MKTIFTHFRKSLILIAILLLSLPDVFCQFVPGAGGAIPTITPYTLASGKIGGFRVTKSCRENVFMGTGTRPLVEMWFPLPSTLDATSYTLQFSTNSGISWDNLQYYGVDLTTNGDNFSINLYADYKLRLFVNGGPKNGFTSNEVYAPLSAIDTWFSGWSMDESMFLTGVMTPWVGHGIEASFNVNKLSDMTEISGSLNYQWYRVNPVTYEMTAVPDSTKLTYTTTIADIGYLNMIRATGDGVNSGGFSQISTGIPTVLPNKASVSNITNNGFTLNLYKSVSSLEAAELLLYDKDYNQVVVNSVTKGSNDAIYNISTALDLSKNPYRLQNISPGWRIASEFVMPMFTDLMEGISVDMTLTGLNQISDDGLAVYPIPAKEVMNFKSNATINQASLFNVKGQELLQTNIDNNVGSLNTAGLMNGFYILRLVTSNGVLSKKVQILN